MSRGAAADLVLLLNDRLVPAARATISALDRGFVYGDGLFETVRTYAGEPFGLAEHLRRLRVTCDEVGRDFAELRLVAKPGTGPDPESGAIDKDNLAGYAELGFHEAILEMPYDDGDISDAIGTLERVAARSWL